MNESGAVQDGVVLVIEAVGEIERIARRLRVRGRILESLGRHDIPSGVVDGSDILVRGGCRCLDCPCRNVEAEEGALKDLIGCFGLVGGDFVTGLVHTCEGVVAVLANLPTDIAAVYLDVGVAGCAEGAAVAVFYCQGGSFAADP